MAKRIFIWILTILLTGLGGCTGLSSSLEPAPRGLVVSAAFGPDGRLWRVTAGREHVYVDHSDDGGRNFSPALVINPDPQPIRATSEDRPDIAVDDQGRILVVYAAAGRWPWTVYYSLSTDGGQHFSPPRPLAPRAGGKTYQVKIGAAGRLFHLFWHQGEATAAGTRLHWSALQDPGRPLQNRILAERQCECCRIALAFDADRRPVLLTRFVFPGILRDHGLIFPATGEIRRVTFDDWHLEACPEHGPALAIDGGGRLHLAWFTLGRKRRGLFYAHSDDRGKTVSAPMPVGEARALAGHPAILARGRRVVLVWQEFDGRRTLVKLIQSHDRGETWSSPRVLASSAKAADYPFLLARGDAIHLSWNTEDAYRFISIP